ncbi:39S ribosomal protein L40, mitochondrial [Ischnura elegans]|uniref:39S ribosomal protein L40, mitochondrial n=1 Tax=Ischnura elegans TaxID=197161 RepID=UPI001ED86A78|nr:39S ribosomal protein L40, mitochondrial [Ischnura elegans]
MMTGLGLLSAALSRVSVVSSTLSFSVTSIRSISLNTNPLLLRTSACHFAEPLKKKKRLDPQVLKQREERKKKRLEKQIRRLERNARQLKPIEEVETPLKLIDERQIRSRNLPPVSPEEEEQRALLFKEWARYKRDQRISDIQMIDRVVFSQQKALDELRIASESLYLEAIKIDQKLLPFEATGPVRTPAIKGYSVADGDYLDVSKKW